LPEFYFRPSRASLLPVPSNSWLLFSLDSSWRTHPILTPPLWMHSHRQKGSLVWSPAYSPAPPPLTFAVLPLPPPPCPPHNTLQIRGFPPSSSSPSIKPGIFCPLVRRKDDFSVAHVRCHCPRNTLIRQLVLQGSLHAGRFSVSQLSPIIWQSAFSFSSSVCVSLLAQMLSPLEMAVDIYSLFVAYPDSTNWLTGPHDITLVPEYFLFLFTPPPRLFFLYKVG